MNICYKGDPGNQQRKRELQHKAWNLWSEATERHGNSDLVAWMRNSDLARGI